MGLGHPPAVLSKPFRLKMIFTVTLVGFTVIFGLVHRLGMPANLPSIVMPLVHPCHGDCPRPPPTSVRGAGRARRLADLLAHGLTPGVVNQTGRGDRDPRMGS
jgi:hypothetical protein